MPTVLSMIFIVVGLGAIPALIFIFLIWNRFTALARAFLVILALLSVLGAINLTFGLGAGIFGRVLSCLLLPAPAVALIVLIAARAAFFRSAGEDRSRRRLYLVGLILIPFLQFAPLLEEFLIARACDALNRRAGDAIVRALQVYRQDHKTYPRELEDLVPRYLPAIPSPRCFVAFEWFHGEAETDLPLPGTHPFEAIEEGFSLHKCDREGVSLLTVYSVEYDFIQRYNLETGRWATVSFLDGKCAYVR